MRFARFDIVELVWIEKIATYSGAVKILLDNDDGGTSNDVFVKVRFTSPADARFREVEDLCLAAAVRSLKEALSHIEDRTADDVRRRVEQPPEWSPDPFPLET